MDGERDWTEVEARALAALEPLGFLLGTWEGEGESHGRAVRARLQVTPVLGGSFLEAVEQHLDEDGGVDHEDRAFYRWEHLEKRLKVLHLMAPAFTTDRVVRLVEEEGVVVGVRWDGGPVAPRVEWRAEGEGGLRCTVTMPYTVEPASTVRYRRGGEGS